MNTKNMNSAYKEGRARQVGIDNTRNYYKSKAKKNKWKVLFGVKKLLNKQCIVDLWHMSNYWNRTWWENINISLFEIQYNRLLHLSCYLSCIHNFNKKIL